MSESTVLFLLATKPLIYFWIFLLAWRRIPAARRPSRGAPVLAAILRTVLALGFAPVLGSHEVFGGGATFAVTCALRGLVWFLCAAVFLEPLGRSGLAVLAFSGASLDTLFDLSLDPRDPRLF